MKLTTTFKFYNDNDAPFFGAYKTGSLTDGEPTLMFCMDAVLNVCKDDSDNGEDFRDIALSTLTHEFCHAMQEWLGKEFDELEVEKILGAYNAKWNVFDTEQSEDEDVKPSFEISELLKRLDTMQDEIGESNITLESEAGAIMVINRLRKLFEPYQLWHEAEKKNKLEKGQ